MDYYRSFAYASSTKKCYRSFLKSYLHFCISNNCAPVPISSHNLCRYIAHLADRLSANSIPRYISVVNLLHKEGDVPCPSHNFMVSSLLKGIQRKKGTTVSRKLPITPHVLIRIKLSLNLNLQEDLIFWSICVTMFFGFFRKGSLLHSNGVFKSSQHIRRQDFTFHPWGISVKVRHSKTIQLQQRCLSVPLVALSNNNALCPVRALLLAFTSTVGADLNGPPFVTCRHGLFSQFSPNLFSTKLKHVLEKAGLPQHEYSGHSFRRGAATWAMEKGMPPDLIQILGDWKSDTYKIYIDLPLTSKVSLLQPYLPNFS